MRAVFFASESSFFTSWWHYFRRVMSLTDFLIPGILFVDTSGASYVQLQSPAVSLRLAAGRARRSLRADVGRGLASPNFKCEG